MIPSVSIMCKSEVLRHATFSLSLKRKLKTKCSCACYSATMKRYTLTDPRNCATAIEKVIAKPFLPHEIISPLTGNVPTEDELSSLQDMR